MSYPTSRQLANNHFFAARRKALIAAILDTLLRQPNDMLNFEDVRIRLNVRGQNFIGHRTVLLDHIVGSEGRYADFDRRFLPRASVTMDRWNNINRMMLAEDALPPVELWKIGDCYFVRDGNHRVSVARHLGQEYIDAKITELIVDVPLTPDLSVRDLLMKEEYSDFLEWTNLHALRPDERIEFTELGGYLDLVRHINVHRSLLARQQNAEIDRDTAVAEWYDRIYLPIVRLIREHNLLRHFAHRTEADLYRWIMEQRAGGAVMAGGSSGGEQGDSHPTEPADAVQDILSGALQVIEKMLRRR